MNKTISVYELLGLIKDGKAPKKIKYSFEIWELVYKNTANGDYDYQNKYGDYLLSKILEYEYLTSIFKTEVKILEEDKSMIEKIDTTTENTLFTMECYTGIPEQAQDWNFNVVNTETIKQLNGTTYLIVNYIDSIGKYQTITRNIDNFTFKKKSK